MNTGAIRRLVDAMPPDAQDRLYSLLKSQPCPFDLWCERFLPHLFRQADGSIEVTPPFARPVRDALTRPGRGKRIAIASFRGSGKTTRNHVAFLLYSIAELGNMFCVSISSTGSTLKDVSGYIQHEAESNEALLHAYPWMVPRVTTYGSLDAWNDRDLIFANGARLAFRSYTSALRGFLHHGRRPEKVIIDDVESEDNSATEAQRDRLRKKLSRSIFGLQGAEGMDIIVQGTPIHPDSLIARMQSDEHYANWEKYFTPAIEDFDNRVSAWPERFSFDLLMSIKEECDREDPDAFFQEYLLRPADPRVMVFRESELVLFDPKEPVKVGALIMAALDVSMGKEHGCDSSICVGALDTSGALRIIEWVTGRMSRQELAAQVERIGGLWPIQSFGVESNGSQLLFIDYFQIRGSKQKFHEIYTVKDKSIRIEGLVAPITTGRIAFAADWKSRPGYATGMRQLINYPNGLVDGPDALELLYSNCKAARLPALQTHGGPTRKQIVRDMMRLT